MRATRVERAVCGLALAAVLARATGCAVGPDYARPAFEAPAAYKELEGWKRAQPGDAELRGAWWELFGEPNLDALEIQVVASNQTLAQAVATYAESRALVREARASYFPTLAVGIGVTRSRSSSNQASSSATRGAVTEQSLPVDVSWEPDLWGRVRRSVEAERAGAQASAGDLASAQLSLQAQLAQDYFELRTIDAERRLLDDTVTAFERSLQLTKNRYEAGVAGRTDVVQAEAQLETTRAQAINLGVQRAQTEHAIARLIGRTPSELSIASAPLDATPPGIPVGLPSELLERRPDVAAAERRVAAANAQIGVAEAAYFPMVTLSASGGFESASLAQWFTWPSRVWSLGPSVSETVFDGGLRRAQTDFARAGYEANVAAYRDTVLAAFQGVEDQLAALRILEDEAAVQGAAVKAAQQSVVLTNNQYRAGTVSYLDVVTVQAIALADERTDVDLLGARMAASVQLIEALGGGWSSAELPTPDQVTRR
jgi:NodT family efflux transporter outer membrane factor (OMF) lipoprotein